MISVICNGREITARGQITLAKLLADQRLAGGPVVVELNGRIIKKREYDSTKLKQGDKIEVVTLVGGG